MSTRTGELALKVGRHGGLIGVVYAVISHKFTGRLWGTGVQRGLLEWDRRETNSLVKAAAKKALAACGRSSPSKEEVGVLASAWARMPMWGDLARRAREAERLAEVKRVMEE